MQKASSTIMLKCNSSAITQYYHHTLPPTVSPLYLSSSSLSISSPSSHQYLSLHNNLHGQGYTHFSSNFKTKGLKVTCSQSEPLKVMISGAPASGKGTQCEMIVQKYGLVHISTGDLLRSEVSAGTEIGRKAKEYMNAGHLVPDEIVTAMVIERLSQKDAKEKGWLLDGYPRSFAQAQSLEKMQIRPDIYIALNVPDDILIDRCVGRRLDPVTGKIYHIKNFPPETEEIKLRLVPRPDDTEEKVKSRLQIYKQNSDAILSTYFSILKKVDGNHSKELVFKEIDTILSQVREEKVKQMKLVPAKSAVQSDSYPNNASPGKRSWRGIPTRLNNVPHSGEIREYFYDDVLQATQRAITAGKTRLKVEINIPEHNPEMVCVQGSMGEGALAEIPLQLAGTRKI